MEIIFYCVFVLFIASGQNLMCVYSSTLWIKTVIKKKKKEIVGRLTFFLLFDVNEENQPDESDTIQLTFCFALTGNILYINYSPLYNTMKWYSSVYFCIKGAEDHCLLSNMSMRYIVEGILKICTNTVNPASRKYEQWIISFLFLLPALHNSYLINLIPLIAIVKSPSYPVCLLISFCTILTSTPGQKFLLKKWN